MLHKLKMFDGSFLLGSSPSLPPFFIPSVSSNLHPFFFLHPFFPFSSSRLMLPFLLQALLLLLRSSLTFICPFLFSYHVSCSSFFRWFPVPFSSCIFLLFQSFSFFICSPFLLALFLCSPLFFSIITPSPYLFSISFISSFPPLLAFRLLSPSPVCICVCDGVNGGCSQSHRGGSTRSLERPACFAPCV